MVGEYYGGGDSGFSSDEDGAQARLNVTMPDDAARNLWDVQAAIQQIAADFQTAVRSAADFSSYLISIRETSQTIKMPSLGMEGGPDGNMTYSGGRVDPGSVPASSGEASMAQRYAEMEGNQEGGGVAGGAMASRNPSARPVDVGGFINSLANSGFMAEMAFRRGGHGGTYFAGETPSEAQQYEQAVAGGTRGDRFAAQNALQMTQGGRSGGGGGLAQATQMATMGLNAGRTFLGGGGLGGVASMFGKLGAIGAAGYAGYQIVNAGLETYAQSRAMALATNNSDNGTGWGFDQRVSQAVMAMSPYVSQEEAAQIYKTAVDQGWASRRGGLAQGDFKGAVDFMYTAAKDYNMDPSMSGQLLQTNALQAGESIGALSEQLLTLKKTLDGTGVSMAAANAGFVSMNSFLVSSGATPQQAAALAGGSLAAFKNNTYLRDGIGSQTILNTLATGQTQNLLSGLTGAIPGTAYTQGHVQKSTVEMQKLVHSLAAQFNSMTGMDEDNRVGMFVQAYNAEFGTNIDQATGKNLMMTALDPNFLTNGQSEYGASSTMTEQHRDGHWYDGLMNWGRARAESGAGADQPQNVQSRLDANAFGYHTYSPEVEALLKTAGNKMDQVKLIGPDGKPVQMNGMDVVGGGITKWLSDQANFDKFNTAHSGYYIQDASGTKYNMSNIGNPSTPATATGQTSANTVYFDMTPELKKYLTMDKSSLSTGSSVANSGN